MNEWSRLRLVTPAAAAVISLDEAKRQCRIDHNDEDAEVETYIAAAQAYVEGPSGIGICLTPQTWRMSLDYFPCEIRIPLGPVSEISSITYTDANGETAEVASWRSDLDSDPARVWPARDASWPAVTCEPGAVKVVFVAGYETPPADLRAAILLLTAHLYANREAATEKALSELPLAVDTILNRYRVGRVA